MQLHGGLSAGHTIAKGDWHHDTNTALHLLTTTGSSTYMNQQHIKIFNTAQRILTSQHMHHTTCSRDTRSRTAPDINVRQWSHQGLLSQLVGVLKQLLIKKGRAEQPKTALGRLQQQAEEAEQTDQVSDRLRAGQKQHKVLSRSLSLWKKKLQGSERGTT